MDPLQLRPGDVDPPVLATGGDEELLVFDLLTRFEDHLVRFGIHRGDVRLEPLHIVLAVPLCGPDIPILERLLRAEVGLRKRRAAEGDPRFAADQHEPALEALVAEGRRGIASRETRADDHEGLAGLHRSHSASAGDLDHCSPPPPAAPGWAARIARFARRRRPGRG
jgi:hypothetical protein